MTSPAAFEDLEQLMKTETDLARARRPNRPALIGVGGAQGSGKSYQCRAYAAAHARVARFSLDDVYYSRAEREAMARGLNPLFATRGPPGTHDLGVATGLIAELAREADTPLPRYDKAADAPAPRRSWPVFSGPAEAVLIDGWCMGALAPAESPPMNAVEREDAPSGWRNAVTWRAMVRTHLDTTYARFFAAFDAIIYLQAPSWEIVRVWRGQQEAETLGRPLTAEENAALDRFVMHYERVTRAMLAGHHRARWVVHLDEARNVVRIEER
jgi:D-glycerate 3-kinase